MTSIFVRAFNSDDVYLINKWRNDQDLQKSTGGVYRKVSLELDREWLKQKMLNDYHEIYWAICVNDETKKMIGYASFNGINYINRVVHGGGILIGDKDYRDGFCAFETLLIMLDYAFNELNMNRFTGSALASHRISNHMMEALLFKKEGVFRQHVYKHGKYHDQNYYAILRDEYYEYINSGEYILSLIIKRFVNMSKDKNRTQQRKHNHQ